MEKNRQVIINLSFPKGGAVNADISKASYLGTEFILSLPSTDPITDKVKNRHVKLIQGTIVS